MPSNHNEEMCGRIAYLTDDAGQVTQTLNYLPYGEDWVDVQNYAETQYPRLGIYRFNGKEKDYESGFHYYGARYYWSETLTGWLSVDPMMDKYPNLSPYNYYTWNPVNVVDPNGMDTVILFNTSKPNLRDYISWYGSKYKDYYDAADKQYKKNKELIQNARRYPNTSDIIHIFAHGIFYPMYKHCYLSWADGKKVDPKGLEEIMANNNGTLIYQFNKEKKLGSVIMLHSCYAGIGFAEELSRIIPNSLIIAPSDIRSISSRIDFEFVDNGGDWLFYYNGEMVYHHLGDIFSTLIMEKNLENYGTDGVLQLNNNNKLEELFK